MMWFIFLWLRRYGNLYKRLFDLWSLDCFKKTMTLSLCILYAREELVA